jgi:hypothetical protein
MESSPLQQFVVTSSHCIKTNSSEVGDPVALSFFRIVGDDEGESLGEIVLLSTTPLSVLK